VLDLPRRPVDNGIVRGSLRGKNTTAAHPLSAYNWTVTPNTIVSINASLSRFAYKPLAQELRIRPDHYRLAGAI